MSSLSYKLAGNCMIIIQRYIVAQSDDTFCLSIYVIFSKQLKQKFNSEHLMISNKVSNQTPYLLVPTKQKDNTTK